ncbi:MAG: class I mannose-6-phosphate isomerase [Clostridia bacterium]|nr:class I mannose-6-phosphate isomerase [Clostridia bacterium]
MILKFKENRVWRAYTGGKRIDGFRGKKNPVDGRMPEEWLASAVEAFNPDRPVKGEGLSVCEDGRLFADILKENPEKILGKELSDKYNGNLSILVKLLDSAERLVIQCHPTVDFAKENFGSMFGKTECWYMLSCDDNACVYLGFKPGITREKWQELFLRQDTEKMLGCLHKFPVKAGDLWFVAGGVPHAIGGGCLMIELQEPSDLMVIPERVTPAGITLAGQKLHGGLGFEKMFDCFNYVGFSEDETRKKYYRKTLFADNRFSTVVGSDLTDKFSMKTLRVKGETEIDLADRYAVAVVVSGSGALKTANEQFSLKKGDNFFITAKSGVIEFSGNIDLIFCIA